MKNEIIMICDIPGEDGENPRENNNPTAHTINLGSKVSFSEYDEAEGKSLKAEGFVLSYTRDCDGTPLYMIGETLSLIQDYQQADLNYHEIKKQLQKNDRNHENFYQLTKESDKQVSIMWDAFRKFNNCYSKESLELVEESTKEEIDMCINAKIIWGSEFYTRFYNKNLY